MYLVINLFFALMVFSSCAFKGEGEASIENKSIEALETNKENYKNTNLSGDLINDFDKLNLGLDPRIAHIPNLRLSFLQNYLIKVEWQSKADGSVGNFTFESNPKIEDHNFKYRVGKLFLASKAKNIAAKASRFSGHQYAEFNHVDENYVSYPSIDPVLYQKAILDYSKYFDEANYTIKNIKVTLENTLRLGTSPIDKTIKDLEVSFFYYSYSKDSWEKVGSSVSEINFYSDKEQSFKVEFENVPIEIVKDNFFRRGEFIASEVTNFIMADRDNIDYKTLLSSIKNKTTRFIIDTPNGERSFYISSNNGVKINEALELIYKNQFTIENNQILKVGQFESNLGAYNHLKELKSEDKKGKWVILSNSKDPDYLNHKYSNDETVYLSYLTGKNLSSEQSEIITTHNQSVSGKEDYTLYPIGNLSSNSNITIQLAPIKRLGKKIIHFKDSIQSIGSCGKNCIPTDFNCTFEVALIEDRNEEYEISKDLKGEIEQLSLMINTTEYSVVDLIAKGHIGLDWIGQNLHLSLEDITKFHEVDNSQELHASVKIKTSSVETFTGLKLLEMVGRDHYYCPMHITNLAGNNKWPISVESIRFNEWGGNIRWDLIARGEKQRILQPFSLSFSSIITNFYN